MPYKFELKEDFIGEDEWVKDTKTLQVYNALLGSDDVQDINNIYKWLTKRQPYLWRVNSKPSFIDERVVGFIIGRGSTNP